MAPKVFHDSAALPDSYGVRVIGREWTLHDLTDAASHVSRESRTTWSHYQNEIARRGNGWHGGCPTLESAQTLVGTGWQEGGDRLSGVVADLAANIPTAKTRTRKPCWSDNGNDLSVDRALAGEWDQAWRSSRREVTRGPSTVDLVVLWANPGHVSSEDVFWTGAVAAVVCDVLESAGYRVGIQAWKCNSFRDGTAVNRIAIKEPHEGMRIDGVASILCHAGPYRQLGFAVNAANPWDCGEGFGKPLRAVAELPAALRPDPDSQLVIEAVYSKDQAIAQIKRLIGKVTETTVE